MFAQKIIYQTCDIPKHEEELKDMKFDSEVIARIAGAVYSTVMEKWFPELESFAKAKGGDPEDNEVLYLFRNNPKLLQDVKKYAKEYDGGDEEAAAKPKKAKPKPASTNSSLDILQQLLASKSNLQHNPLGVGQKPKDASISPVKSIAKKPDRNSPLKSVLEEEDPFENDLEIEETSTLSNQETLVTPQIPSMVNKDKTKENLQKPSTFSMSNDRFNEKTKETPKDIQKMPSTKSVLEQDLFDDDWEFDEPLLTSSNKETSMTPQIPSMVNKDKTKENIQKPSTSSTSKGFFSEKKKEIANGSTSSMSSTKKGEDKTLKKLDRKPPLKSVEEEDSSGSDLEIIEPLSTLSNEKRKVLIKPQIPAMMTKDKTKESIQKSSTSFFNEKRKETPNGIQKSSTPSVSSTKKETSNIVQKMPPTKQKLRRDSFENDLEFDEPPSTSPNKEKSMTPQIPVMPNKDKPKENLQKPSTFSASKNCSNVTPNDIQKRSTPSISSTKKGEAKTPNSIQKMPSTKSDDRKKHKLKQDSVTDENSGTPKKRRKKSDSDIEEIPVNKSFLQMADEAWIVP